MKKIMPAIALSILFFGCSTVHPLPDVAKAYNDRGKVDLVTDNYGKGVNDFTKAIEFDPDNSEAYIGRGLAYLKGGDKEKADADFSKAASLDPNLKGVLKSLRASGWQHLGSATDGSNCYFNADSVSSPSSGIISYRVRFDEPDGSYTLYDFQVNCQTHQGRWQNIWPKYYSVQSEWKDYGDNYFYGDVARKYCR